MQRKLFIGVSVCVVVIFIFGALTNVIGYQTVQSSAPPPIAEQNQVNNQLEQKEVAPYSNSGCGCKRENTALWHFPVICTILYIPVIIGLFLFDIAAVFHNFFLVNLINKILSPFYQIGKVLNCFWIDALYFEDLHKIILR